MLVYIKSNSQTLEICEVAEYKSQLHSTIVKNDSGVHRLLIGNGYVRHCIDTSVVGKEYLLTNFGLKLMSVAKEFAKIQTRDNKINDICML